MAKLLIEIDLPDDEERHVAPWAIEHCFRYLMADAVSEFYRSRGYREDHHDDNTDGVNEYVERRYEGMDEKFKARKRGDVMLRCRVARALHEGFLSPTRLEVIESGPSAPVTDADASPDAVDRTDPGVPESGSQKPLGWNCDCATLPYQPLYRSTCGTCGAERPEPDDEPDIMSDPYR